MFILKAGFRDGWRGLVVALLSTFYVFLRYAKLWELIYIKKQDASISVAYGRRGEAETPESKPAESKAAESKPDEAQPAELPSGDSVPS